MGDDPVAALFDREIVKYRVQMQAFRTLARRWRTTYPKGLPALREEFEKSKEAAAVMVNAKKRLADD